MRAIVLDTPVRRHLGREISHQLGPANALQSPVAVYAKDDASSTAFLVLDVVGARLAADELTRGGLPTGERANLWAELVAVYTGTAE